MPIYTIQKWNHYCDGINFKPIFNPKNKSYIVKFSPSCIYDIGPDQGDINKLCGFSYIDVRSNSIRFGWRCVLDKIEVVGYMHDGQNVFGKSNFSVHTLIPLCFVYPNQEVLLKIETSIKNNHYNYVLSAETQDKVYCVTIDKKYSMNWFQKCFCFSNFPYFGGNKTAPHDITLDLKEL